MSYVVMSKEQSHDLPFICLPFHFPIKSSVLLSANHFV